MKMFVFKNEEDRLKKDKIKEKFDQYFLLWRSIIYERANSTSECKSLTKLPRNLSCYFTECANMGRRIKAVLGNG